MAFRRCTIATAGGRSSFTMTGPQQDLNNKENRGRERGNKQLTLFPVSPPGYREKRKDRYRHQGGDPAMTDLYERGQIERRNHCPSHNGQRSPQPSPEPVIRTTPPKVIRPITRTECRNRQPAIQCRTGEDSTGIKTDPGRKSGGAGGVRTASHAALSSGPDGGNFTASVALSPCRQRGSL